MPIVYKYADISKLNDRQIFFDANIIIYIFWPTSSKFWEQQYSSIFKRLLTQRNDMVVDFIVISEVINRIIRIEYEKYLQQSNIKKMDLKFKDYRDSKFGCEAQNDIYQIIRSKIINRFSIASKEFTKTDIENFLHADFLDFSDKGIAEICKENNFVLLTNDKDFANVELEILTANNSFLQKHDK